MEKNLESSGAGFGIGSMIRSLADRSRAKAKEQQREARTGEHLPTLTSGSMDNLVTGLGNGERVAQVDALTILGAATVMLMDEPSVCDITVPPKGKCIVVGDLHGQLVSALQHSTTQPSTDPRARPLSQDDLLHLFKTFGQPSEKMTWIFNGDLVDRGDHACEIVLLIFALKLKHPRHVFRQPRQPRGAAHKHIQRLRGGVHGQVRPQGVPDVPRRLCLAPVRVPGQRQDARAPRRAPPRRDRFDQRHSRHRQGTRRVQRETEHGQRGVDS